MTSTTKAAVTEHATCPRCRLPLTLEAACEALASFGGAAAVLTADPTTPLLAHLVAFVPWICGRCGEDSELPDFRGEAPVVDLRSVRKDELDVDEDLDLLASFGGEDLDLIDEDPPADVDEQLRAMLFEVSAMAVSLRSTIDRAPALHHRLGKALADLAQSRHHFEVICRMYTDGESGADDYAAAVLEEMNAAEVSRG